MVGLLGASCIPDAIRGQTERNKGRGGDVGGWEGMQKA